jgi:large subunit ribosomal protein L13
MPSTTQKTYSPKASEVTHAWRLVDADGQTLGRLATQIATWLRGKHLPTFSEHMDLGDFVVVVNASSIRVSGNKPEQRMYYRHSTYPGGLKTVALGDLLAKHPERVIKHTVRGMLPHNALGRKMLRKLKVYAGPQHPHSAQFRAWEKQQQRTSENLETTTP